MKSFSAACILAQLVLLPYTDGFRTRASQVVDFGEKPLGSVSAVTRAVEATLSDAGKGSAAILTQVDDAKVATSRDAVSQSATAVHAEISHAAGVVAQNQSALLEQRASMLPPVGGRLSLASRPSEVLGLLFFAICLGYFCYVQCCLWPDASECDEVRKALRVEHDWFLNQVEEILEPLQPIQETSTQLVEPQFLNRYRSFIRWLHAGVRRDEGLHEDCLLEWLDAFRECSADPENHPIVIECSKLRGVSSVKEAEDAIQELQQRPPPKFAISGMMSAQGWHQKYLERKKKTFVQAVVPPWIQFTNDIANSWTWKGGVGEYPLAVQILWVKLAVSSRWHSALLLSALFGIGLAVFLHSSWRHVAALGVDVAVGLLLWVCSRAASLDDRVHLDAELAELAVLQEEVEAIAPNMQKVVQDFGKLCVYWKQTMNKFDLWSEASRLRDVLSAQKMPQEEKTAIVGKMSKGIQRLLDAMVELPMYLESSDTKEAWLSKVNDHLKEGIARFGEKINRRDPNAALDVLDNIFGFVVVHVVGATQLQHGRDVYVETHLGSQWQATGRRCTEVMSGQTNPKWDQRFCIWAAPIQEPTLMFSVRSAGVTLGTLSVPYNARPAEWVHVREQLQGASSQGSSLEVQLFFGTGAKHLELLTDEQLPRDA